MHFFNLIKIALCFLPLASFSQTSQMQKVKVIMRHITCKGLDDDGITEELYGKIWALNLSPYKNLETARQNFNNDEIIKIGQGGGEIWKLDRDHYLAIKKGQTIRVSKSIEGQFIEIVCKKTDKIIVMGDMNERDWGWRSKDDLLASKGSIENKVVDLASFDGTYLVNLIFKSGGTEIWVEIAVEKHD